MRPPPSPGTDSASIDSAIVLRHADAATGMLLGPVGKWRCVDAVDRQPASPGHYALITLDEQSGESYQMRLGGSAMSTKLIAQKFTGGGVVNRATIDELLSEWCNMIVGGIKGSLPGQWRLGLPAVTGGGGGDWHVLATLSVGPNAPLTISVR